MGLLQRQSLIERLASQDGWLVTAREADYHEVRLPSPPVIRYVRIRCRDDLDNVLFWTNLPVQFPMAMAPPELFKTLLMRNRRIRFGAWTIDLTGSLDVWVYVSYVAHKAALSPKSFGDICRDLLAESEAMFNELREQFARLDVDRSNASMSVGRTEVVGQSLPPGLNRAISWTGR